VQGKILLCFPSPDDQNSLIPRKVFREAAQFVMNEGGHGLIFAQYTTDIISDTTCQGIVCVLVDLDTGKKIINYWVAATTYVRSNEFDSMSKKNMSLIQHEHLIDGDNIFFL
jgi:hypothetical protein